MGKLIVILLVALVLEAVGVVFLNLGLKQIGEITVINWTEIKRLAVNGITNPNILLGVFFEALFFAGLLILLSRSDVSFIWPLTSLGFVITTLAAHYVLHEKITALRWAGVMLIVLGAGLVSWTEAHKDSPPSPGQNTAASRITE
jgi:drug/metabolite transporter (DMT)-like permease